MALMMRTCSLPSQHGLRGGPLFAVEGLLQRAAACPSPQTAGLPISAIGGITTWRDAAEFIAMGAGTVQVCTAAMTYGFRIVEEMISGLKTWMDVKGYATIDGFRASESRSSQFQGNPEKGTRRETRKSKAARRKRPREGEVTKKKVNECHVFWAKCLRSQIMGYLSTDVVWGTDWLAGRMLRLVI